MIMYGFTSLLGINRKTPHYINRGSWPVGAENIANGNAAKKMGGKKDRSHLILEIQLFHSSSLVISPSIVDTSDLSRLRSARLPLS